MVGISDIGAIIKRFGDIEYFAGSMVHAVNEGRIDIASEMLEFIESGLYKIDKRFLEGHRRVLDDLSIAVRLGRDNEVDMLTERLLNDLYNYVIGRIEDIYFSGR